MLSSVFVLSAVLIVLISVNPWLALLAISILGGLYVLIYFIKQKLAKYGRTLVKTNDARYVVSTELIGGIKDIKMLGREAEYIKRFQNFSHTHARISARSVVIKQISYLIEAIAFGTIIGLIIVIMLSRSESAERVLGEMLPILGVYAFAAYKMKPAIQGIYKGISSLNCGYAVINSISSFLALEGRIEPIVNDNDRRFNPKHNIAFEEIYFKYPTVEENTLHEININIPTGTTLGIVGSTGAGKTSFIDLFLGLLKPTSGNIFVDGELISDQNRSDWRRSVGYVSQDIFLADTTILSNIALGIDVPLIDKDRVKASARVAQIHDFIENDLPNGYNTSVGERGIRLSGGQRQRIGIARALYSNSNVLVFDEATSALDTSTERALIDEIKNLASEKTIVMVTHRLSTIKFCDNIIVLKAGRIVDYGTYGELKNKARSLTHLLPVQKIKVLTMKLLIINFFWKDSLLQKIKF